MSRFRLEAVHLEFYFITDSLFHDWMLYGREPMKVFAYGVGLSNDGMYVSLFRFSCINRWGRDWWLLLYSHAPGKGEQLEDASQGRSQHSPQNSEFFATVCSFIFCLADRR